MINLEEFVNTDLMVALWAGVCGVLFATKDSAKRVNDPVEIWLRRFATMMCALFSVVLVIWIILLILYRIQTAG